MNPFALALFGMTTNMFLMQAEATGKLWAVSVLGPSTRLFNQYKDLKK